MKAHRDPTVALMKRLSLFHGCTDDELLEIAGIADQLQLAAGKRLTTEGERGQEFVLILDGEAEVYKQDELVAVLGQDDFVGEISLLTGSPRTATVVARTPVSVLVIARHRFAELLDRIPAIRTKLEAVVPLRQD